MNFDKQKVLEKILEECPIKTNLRGEIRVDGEKRVIYAYYFNQGIPDPKLKYDRARNPIRTTLDSTLCEVYSIFDEEKTREKFIENYTEALENLKPILEESKQKRKGKPDRGLHRKDFVEKFEKELQDLKSGKPIYSGPLVEQTKIGSYTRQKISRDESLSKVVQLMQGMDMDIDDMDIDSLYLSTQYPAEVIRDSGNYDYYHSAFNFIKHFNRICKNLKYDSKLVDEFNERNNKTTFFLKKKGKKVPFKMDLIRTDPKIIEVITVVEKILMN